MTPIERFLHEAERPGEDWREVVTSLDAWRLVGKKNGWNRSTSLTRNGMTHITTTIDFRLELFMQLLEAGKDVDFAMNIAYTSQR